MSATSDDLLRMAGSELVGRVHALERRLDDLTRPEIPVVKGVAVYNDDAISVGNAAWTALTFNSERRDDNGFHSVVANTSRLTVPTGNDGWYVISGHVNWAANAVGRRRVAVRLGGVTYIADDEYHTPDASLALSMSIATLYYLAATDYVELAVYQNTGGNLNVNAVGNYSPEFRMVRVI